MKPTRLWRFTFQPHWRCFSIIVPHASKYFQSCLPLLHPVNIIFQGQYECLGKYGVTGHLSFCFLFASTFRVVPASLPISAFFRCREATACWMPKPKNVQQEIHFFEQNEMFNSWLDLISVLLLQALYGSAWARVCMESLNERYADVQCCLGTTWWSFSCEILVGNQYSCEPHPCSISPCTCSLHNRCGLLQSLANRQDLRVLLLGNF